MLGINLIYNVHYILQCKGFVFAKIFICNFNDLKMPYVRN